MPARYSIKTFTPNAYYHIYNRGVEKRQVFMDEQDYGVLFSYLKEYLIPKNEKALYAILANPLANWRDKDKAIKLLRLNNFTSTISLIACCLMQNHFHILLKQSDITAMDQFMNSLWTRYTMYFNRKYKRIGPLFQGVYKAVLVTTEEQLLHLSRYIHRNSIAKRGYRNLASQGDALRSYSWSSYPEYVGIRQTEWIDPRPILSHWKNNQSASYEQFVLQTDNEMSARIIAPIIIAA